MVGAIYECKPAYETLKPLLNPLVISNKYSDTINVIVDLKEVVKKMFRLHSDEDPNVVFRSKTKLAEARSEVLAIIGHYRNFFYYTKKYTNFWFVYSSTPCDELLEVLPEYKSEYYDNYYHDTQARAFITNTFKFLKAVIEILPNCHYIDSSDTDESAVIKRIIDKHPKNQLNLILSGDAMLYRHLAENVYALDLKGNYSKLIGPKDLPLVKALGDLIEPAHVILFGSLTGYKKYNLCKVNGIGPKAAVEIIETLQIGTYIPLDLPMELLNVSNTALKPAMKKKLLEPENIIGLQTNYKVLNTDWLLCKYEDEIDAGFIKAKKDITLNMLDAIVNKYLSTVESPPIVELLVKGENVK